jgi:hypothetical protein
MPERASQDTEPPLGYIASLGAYGHQLSAGLLVLFFLDAPALWGAGAFTAQMARWLVQFAADTYLIRWLIHLRLGYLRWSPGPVRPLGLVTLADGFLAGYLIWASVHLFGPAGIGRSLLALAPMCLAVPFLAIATIHLLRRPELEHQRRGSEWVQELWIVKKLSDFLEPGRGAPVISTVRAFLRWVTPPRDVSAYIIGFMALSLVIASGLLGSGKKAVAAEHGNARHTADSGTAELVRLLSIFYGARQLTLGPGNALPAGSSDGASYQDDCRNWPSPGSPAPAPQGPLLAGQFEGGDGIAGLGASTAGCAWHAHPERSEPSRWWVTGWCGLDLRSFALAWPRGSAIALQQVAVFARLLAEHGLLLGMTERRDAGEGDFQLLHTTNGDVLFSRSEKSTGAIHPTGEAGSCRPLLDSNVDYTVLPPAMSVLWERLVLKLRVWVWPVADPSQGGRAFTFISAGTQPRVVARGRCQANGRCSISVGLRTTSLAAAPRDRVSLKAMGRFIPPSLSA